MESRSAHQDDAWLHFETALLPGGWADDVRIAVAAGVITQIQPAAPSRSGDARSGVGLPGLPNLHSHAFQRGMAGLAESRGGSADSFWTWRETMYRFVAAITPDDLEAIAALAFVEMLESGFTRVGEFHYLHRRPDGGAYDDPAEMAARIAAAAQDTGIALTLLPVFYAHGGFGGMPLQERQKRFASSLDSYADLVARSRKAVAGLRDGVVGIAPHSLRAVTPDELAALLPLAGDGPIHIHIAEQMLEVEACVAWFGARPVTWLMDHADVGPRWCAVHATHMDDAESARLAASGAVAGLCPITEANLGDGLFAAPRYLAAGGSFGIGSDSNVLIDMREELRLLEYGQRLHARSRNVLASVPSVGRSLFDGAVAGGARALGCAAGLRVGARADIVGLSIDQPALVGRKGDALLDSLIFAHARIADVWAGGEHVVSGGEHRARGAVIARYRAVLHRLLAA
ncbi:MAG: formimidoylglutamate deiminase [Rhizomicrobium sp.]